MANRASDFTNLPEACAAALVQHMSSVTRSSWRLVNQRACNSVYAATRRLTCCRKSGKGDRTDSTVLPAHLLSMCTGVKKLNCSLLCRLSSLRGLPRSLEVLNLRQTAVATHPCPGVNFLHLANCSSSLRSLSLCGVPLRAEGAKALAPALRLLTGLTSLDLSHTDPGTEGIVALSPALRQLTNLQEAMIGGNKYSPDELEACAAALAYALQPLTGLRHLDLLVCRSVFLSAARPLQLLTSAMQGMTALQSLDLAEEAIEDDVAAVIIGLLGHLTGLEQLSVTTDGLSFNRLSQLADAVARLRGLRNLHFCLLDADQDSPEGAALLLPCSLHGLTALTCLNLSDHRLGVDGAVALCGPLGQLTGLQCLFLVDNNLGAEGAAALAAALRRLTSLQCLWLDSNNLQAAGATALAPALSALPALTHLRLNDNAIGGKGAAALAPALGSLPALTELFLNDNAIGSKGAAALAPAIRRLAQLQRLELTGNGLVAEDLVSMAPMIRID